MMFNKTFPTSKIKFLKRKHIYLLKSSNKQLCSVTTWIKSFFEAFDADKVAFLSANKYVRENFPQLEGQERQKAVSVRARDLKKQWKTISSKGTSTHENIESFIRNLPYELDPKAQAAVVFLGDARLLRQEHLFPEVQLYDEELGLCGTTDLIYSDGEQVIIVDWKTNKEIKKEAYKGKTGFGACSNIPDSKYHHYYIQLSTYAYLLSRKGYDVSRCVLVHLRDDGYTPYEFAPDFELVKRMLEEKNGYQAINTTSK